MAIIKKERIKDQMVRTAARLWGVQENEIDTGFDPLILLMIDACAAELEKIGYNIGASHSRLLDKLASLILPDAMIGPRPASCILHADPVDATAILDTETRFFSTQRLRTLTGFQNVDVFFGPAGRFLLHKVQLSYSLIGNKLYRIQPTGQRELLAGSESDGLSNVNELWLAITPDKAVQSLKGLSFYFDLRSNSEAGAFYKSLETVRGFIGNEPLVLKAGYYNKNQFEPDLQEMIVSGDDYTKKVARHAAGVYQNRFLHIAGDQDVSKLVTTEVPAAWAQRIPAPVLQQLAAQPMIYIKLELSRVFHQEVLDAMLCSINAFPVLNRKLNLLNYRTDPWINIVPVNVEGSFLDLHAITSINGGGYKFRMSSDAHGMEEGEAMVRSTGVGKADSREVREIIGSLLEAIRDESAFFSEINNEFIQSRLKEISQILARLEDQVDRSKDRQSGHHYILLRSKAAGEQLAIHYWTTNGSDANGIRAGNYLTPFNHTLVAARGAYLVTNSIGGKSSLSENEKKNLLKQQLVSKGRIVSADDVKMLCAQLFGDQLQQVTVKKGIQVGAGKGEGFERTIDVQLTLAPATEGAGEDDLNYLCSELEYLLQANGSPVYPFRVIVETHS
jgi:hypothetical protein